MILNFQKYAQTGEAFVKRIAEELGDSDGTSKASRILRSTLQVLRDQSTPEESVQFIAQLPSVSLGVLQKSQRPVLLVVPMKSGRLL